MTALHFLSRSVEFLRAKGVENPRLDAELLLAHVLGVDRIGVYLNFDRPLVAAEVEAYRELVRRRGKREPLQHLVGRQEFWSRTFRADRRALVPRADSETLVEAVLAAAKTIPFATVLDVGTGSGILAVTLALELPEARVVAVDRSPEALALARENAAALGAGRIDFREGDLFAPVHGDAFDVVVANPPYVPTAEIETLEPEVREHDPRLALDGGGDGLDVLRRIASEVPAALTVDGSVFLEVGMGQAPAACELLRAAGLTQVGVRRDLSGIERVVTGRKSPAFGSTGPT